MLLCNHERYEYSANDDAPIDPAQGDINADGEDWDGGDEDWSSGRSGSFDGDEDDEREQAEVTFVITSINTWNRFAVGFRAVHPIRDDA